MNILLSIVSMLLLAISIFIVAKKHGLAAKRWLLLFLICLLSVTFMHLGTLFFLSPGDVDVTNSFDSFQLISVTTSIINACAWLFLLKFIITFKAFIASK